MANQHGQGGALSRAAWVARAGLQLAGPSICWMCHSACCHEIRLPRLPKPAPRKPVPRRELLQKQHLPACVPGGETCQAQVPLCRDHRTWLSTWCLSKISILFVEAGGLIRKLNRLLICTQKWCGLSVGGQEVSVLGWSTRRPFISKMYWIYWNHMHIRSELHSSDFWDGGSQWLRELN